MGLEDAVEDAANDPTLHSVSNSWGYAGEPEWGTADPFMQAVQNSFAIAAAAGTTFYFSTGDFGTYMSGFPADSEYVVSVGGTSDYSTADTGKLSTALPGRPPAATARTSSPARAGRTSRRSTTWRPAPGRVSPDISAVADPNTGVRYVGRATTTAASRPPARSAARRSPRR